jgi:hypothetical protein
LNHPENKLAHIANLQCGQAHFTYVLETVEKKDGSISNDTAETTPRQDAMNWFACCRYSLI